MRRRAVRSEPFYVCTAQRLPLVTKGSCRRRRLMRSEGRRSAQHPPAEVRQNLRLLIPSVTAAPCHRLAAARSRRGSDSLPGCHSTPRRRFATLVTKGSLGLLQIWQIGTHRRICRSSLALPLGEPRMRAFPHRCVPICRTVLHGRGLTLRYDETRGTAHFPA